MDAHLLDQLIDQRIVETSGLDPHRIYLGMSAISGIEIVKTTNHSRPSAYTPLARGVVHVSTLSSARTCTSPA